MKKSTKIISRIFIGLMLLFVYAPIIILIIFSFSTNKVIGDWKHIDWSFQLYNNLFSNEEIMDAVKNTLIVAIVSSILATFIGTLGAVGIFHLRKLPKAMVNTVSQITVINADIVTGVAFMLFFFACMGNIKGFPALIIAHTVITMPYVVLSVMPRLNQLNPNLYEAGLDLGAGPVKTLFSVLFPQLVPGMLSGFAMAFTLSLDDFVISKFINGNVNTISTMIYNSTKHGIDTAYRALSSIIFLVVLLILIGINVYKHNKRKKYEKNS